MRAFKTRTLKFSSPTDAAWGMVMLPRVRRRNRRRGVVAAPPVLARLGGNLRKKFHLGNRRFGACALDLKNFRGPVFRSGTPGRGKLPDHLSKADPALDPRERPY
jgi:hypothetical protein